jgi:hypothetical protein
MQRDDHERVLDRLLEIDDILRSLAQEASDHVGVDYRHSGLGLLWGAAGAEISGGPSGDAGDIYFELHTWDQNYEKRQAPPWTVDSQIIVFCVDPQRGEDPRTHVLYSVVTEADTPTTAVETLATHVGILREEILKRKASEFTESPHAALVAGEAAQGRA